MSESEYDDSGSDAGHSVAGSVAASVASTPQMRNQMGDFTAKVKRMCELEDQLKMMNAERKAINDEKNRLKEEVMGFMAEKNVGSVNYKNEVIYIEKREAQQSLTRKTLINALKNVYGVEHVNLTKDEAEAVEDEVSAQLQRAQSLYDSINDFLGTTEKVVLVREERDKKKRERKPPAPLSVYDAGKKPPAKKVKTAAGSDAGSE